MAFPYNFIKLTFGGDLLDTEEIWTCGIQLSGLNHDLDAFSLGVNDTAKQTAIKDAVVAFVGDSANRIPTRMRLQWVKWALIGKNGKYIGAPMEVILETPQTGTNNDGFIPSTAMVYTLSTNKFKDPGKYNRFYLPTVPPSTTNTYQETAQQGAARAASAVTFINAINSAFESETAGAVVSAVSQRVSLYQAITKVRVGDIIDTQRRRRNKLYESYSEAELS